jgi:hypothetical protein
MITRKENIMQISLYVTYNTLKFFLQEYASDMDFEKRDYRITKQLSVDFTILHIQFQYECIFMSGVTDNLPRFVQVLSLQLGTPSQTGVGLPPVPSS